MSNQKDLQRIVQEKSLGQWDIFNDGSGLAIQRCDDHGPPLVNDSCAIALAKAAGIECDYYGRIEGHHPKYQNPQSWDVFLDTGVIVNVYADPDSIEGYAAIRAAAKEILLRIIENDQFDVSFVPSKAK